MTEADAWAIADWRYPPPYDFYDLEPGEREEMLDPASGCRAVFDESGELVGFGCFGAGGRLPGAERAGLYREAALDIGLGLRPDLTGGGRGRDFVEAVLAEARARRAPARFRLAVAAFNTRAIRVYEQVGFIRIGACTSPVRDEEIPFIVMARPADDNRSPGTR
jgi:GNAT superfamily N-acetyltransferase